MLFEKIFDRAKADPDGPAFFIRERQSLSIRSNRVFARELKQKIHSAQLLPGDTAAVLGGNSYEWILTVWGLLGAGKRAALLDPSLNPADLKEALHQIQPSFLFYDSKEEALAGQLTGSCTICQYEKLNRLADVDRTSVEDDVLLQDNARYSALICFTSGTTKNSKAVLVPLSCMEGHISGLQPMIDCRPGWKAYLPVPLHHAFGIGALMTLFAADCSICIGSMRTVKYDLQLFQPEFAAAVPSLLTYLLKKDLLKNTGLHTIMTAGGICSPALAEQIRSYGIRLQNDYGSSEMSVGVAISAPNGPIDEFLPIPQLKIHITPPGEVWLHTPWPFQEYIGKPEETSDSFTDGYFHTGDEGYLDEKGHLHLGGRKKDHLILENGEKIFCPDVEEALSAAPGWKDGAVLLMDAELTLVVQPEQDADTAALLSFVNTYNKLQPSARKIQKVLFQKKDLPRTSTGKLKRAALESALQSAANHGQ